MIELDEMKRRILKAHKYREDLVEPLSEVLDLEEEKVVDLIIDKLDMLRLQGLQPRYESRRKNIRRGVLEGKVKRDLHLPLLSDYLSILNKKEAKQLSDDITEKVLSGGKDYKTALKEGKKRLREMVRDEI